MKATGIKFNENLPSGCSADTDRQTHDKANGYFWWLCYCTYKVHNNF